MELIELYDENGHLERFYLLDTFGLDDDTFVALLPEKEVNQQTYLLKLDYDDAGNAVFSGIEDDALLEEVIEIYEELKKEQIQ